MASNMTDSVEGDGSESKGGSKLDNLSREDLIKFVKKQMTMLQKSKSHCDDLNRELIETKSHLKQLSDNKAAETKAEELDEKENLIEAYNASQTALEESATKIASLTEQMNCLQQKNDTLTALYQCMQSELDTTTSRTKELENSMAVLSEAHDKALRQLNLQETAVNQVSCPNCEQLKSAADELMAELDMLKQRLEYLESAEAERSQLKLDLNQSQEKLSKAVVFIDKLKKERQELKERTSEIKASHQALMDLQEAFDSVRQELAISTEEKLKMSEELKTAKNRVAESCRETEKIISEKSELALQMEDLQKTFADIESQFKVSKEESEFCSERVRNLKKALSDEESHVTDLQSQLDNVVANSHKLEEEFNNVKAKLDEVTLKKLTTDEAVEKLFACLTEAGKGFKQEYSTVMEFHDAEELLKEMKDELVDVRREMDSLSKTNQELQERLINSEECHNKVYEGNRLFSGESEKEINSDITQDLLRQIDELRAEVASRTKREEEVNITNEELRLQIEQLQMRPSVSLSEDITNEEIGLFKVDERSKETTRVLREFSSESIGGDSNLSTAGDLEQNISERDVLIQELMFLRGKLAEWETMMLMLQREKDGMEKELTKMGEREGRNSDLLEEILLVLQNALKGRDLFHDQTKMMEDNGVLYAKLCILQGIVDETNFERDEMKEKIQHLNEQVADLEGSLAETAERDGAMDHPASDETQRRDYEVLLSTVEKLEVGNQALQVKLAEKEHLLLKAFGENDNDVGGLSRRVETLNTEVEESKQLLEAERSACEEWKNNWEADHRLVEGLQMENELLEKIKLEKEEEIDKSRLENEQLQARLMELQNHEGRKTSAGDGSTDSQEIPRLEIEPAVFDDERLLMTDQVKLITVKRNNHVIMQAPTQEEKTCLLEENQSLKEEINLLKKQLEFLFSKSNFQETSSPPTLLPEGSSEKQRVKEHQVTLDGIRNEIERTECVLREKREELTRLYEEGYLTRRESNIDEERERSQMEYRRMKEEFDFQLLEKSTEIEKLRSELSGVSTEADHHDGVKEIFTAVEELTDSTTDGKDFASGKGTLDVKVAGVKHETEYPSSGKDEEIQKLREERGKIRIEADVQIKELEDQLQSLREEFEKYEEVTAVRISDNDKEKQRLESLLSTLKEENEVGICDRETEICKLRADLARAQGELANDIKGKEMEIERLEKEFIGAKEEAEVRLKDEILENNSLKSELARLREEAADCMVKANFEMEELKQELLKVKTESDSNQRSKDDAVSALNAELAKLAGETDLLLGEKDAKIKELNEEIERTKETETHLKDKDDLISSLENNLTKLRQDFESLNFEKELKVRELEDLLNRTQESKTSLENKNVEIENVKLEMLRVKEEAENCITEKEKEVERLKAELHTVTGNTENHNQEKDLEMENLKAEFESQVNDKSSKIQRLEEKLSEFEGRLTDKDHEIKEMTAALFKMKEETENQSNNRDAEIKNLKEEILMLRNAECEMNERTSQIERLRAQLLSADERSECHLKEKDCKIQELTDDLLKIRKEQDDLISRKNAEVEKLHTECEEKEQQLQSREAEMQSLEQALSKLQAEADQINALNLELSECQQECNEFKAVLSRREDEIRRLKEEIAAVKSEMETSFDRKEEKQVDIQSGQLEVNQLQTSVPSSSPGETVALLQQQLKDREERENKLKQLTLKSKKETAELKTKLNACQKDLEAASAKLLEANSSQSIQFQSLQTEYEKLESLFEAEESAKQELQKNLKQTIEELSNLKVSFAELTEEKSKMLWELQKLEREKKDSETLHVEKEQEYQAERIQREQMARDKAEVEIRLLKQECLLKEMEDELKTEVKHLQDQLRTSKQELSLAKTEIQQSNMMDLEIADYERAVKALNETVAERNAKIKSLNEEIEQQQEQRVAMQKLLDSSTSQYTQLDDHSNKLKQLLVKSKKDLAEAKKLEGEQHTTNAQLRGQMERLTQLTEEQKIQIASLVAENQRQADNLRLHSDTHQRTAQSLELQVQSLENDLRVARSEMAAIQSEYDGYKVRVHSVLKNQKTRSGVGEDASLERERFERQQLERLADSLKAKLADVSNQMSSLSSENEFLQEEHERLQTRHSKLVSEMETKERNWRDRLEKLNAESSLNSQRKVEVIQQLTVQSETISSNYRDQIQAMQEEHQRVTNSLKHQLEMAEIELDRYHARYQNANQNPLISSASSLPTLDHEASTDRVLEFVKELRPEERQSGEGSENVEDLHVKTSSATNHNLLPFEQLLDSQQTDDVISIKTVESTAEELSLRSNLASAEKKIEHLAQILNESEATVLQLTEQASLLKGEIRRMERNQEREAAISNMEYLKNIVYKFLTLKSGDERLQLIPVLTTMLKFSPDEKDKMTAIAVGNEATPPPGQDASSWSAYLHRWSGLT